MSVVIMTHISLRTDDSMDSSQKEFYMLAETSLAEKWLSRKETAENLGQTPSRIVGTREKKIAFAITFSKDSATQINDIGENHGGIKNALRTGNN